MNNIQNRLLPQKEVPELKLNLINGEKWSLNAQNPNMFTMVIFYRGLHCPVCEKYLKTLDSLLLDYKEKGVEVIAVSMDGKVRARLTKRKWGYCRQILLPPLA